MVSEDFILEQTYETYNLYMILQLVKQTSIQATGVASSLVEIIEQAGFKMQALSLGFDDDDAEDDDYIDYDASTGDEEATAE